MVVIDVRCNWKLAVENYCEAYHLPWVHPALNDYSRLEDHYCFSDAQDFAGQGSLAYRLSDVAGTRLPRLEEWGLEGWRLAPISIVEQGRVAIGDEIGAALDAEIAVVISNITDAPGLAEPSPLGTGKRRPSANVSLVAVMSRNV